MIPQDALIEAARKAWGPENGTLSSRYELRFGDQGSKALDLRKQRWFDHETGEGGGYVKLFRLAGMPIPNGGGAGGKITIIAEYDYLDEHGALLSQVVRLAPKDFRQRRPDGFGGWIWGLGKTRRVLYRLPDLLAANPDQLVFIPEGEKDVDKLRDIGLVATTNPSGVGKWRKEYNQHLAGRDVVVLPDNDPQATNPDGAPRVHPDGSPVLPGQDHAAAVAASLIRVARSVRILDLPGLGSKGDVSDWLAAGGTKEKLLELAQAAPVQSGGTRSGGAPETDGEVIARLALLSPFEYERVREEEAKKLGWRASILDKLVGAARDNGAGNGTQGHELQLNPPEPWPKPVDGAALLASLASFYARHVFLPPNAADAMAVWAMHTHCFECFRHSPRLTFTSPVKGCGKTTALDTLAITLSKPLAASSITAAALFSTVEQAKPSLLLDEADTFLPENEELRGAVNAGHKVGGQVIRCVGEDAEPRAFAVFAPCAIAAIGRLPGTIEDRAIKIPMQKVLRSERREMLDEGAELEGMELARQCARWASDHRARLRAVRPTLPPELFNRAADNWRLMFAIAEIAGGDWPNRMKACAAALVPDDDEAGGIRLLADIKAVFDGGTDLDKDAPNPVDTISSELLCKCLAALETSPWGEYGRARKPITQRQLARVLLPFKIVPGTVRLASGKTPKGYHRGAFRDAWTRYLDEDGAAPPGEGGFDPPHRHTPTDADLFPKHDPQQTGPGVADRTRHNPASEAGCVGVAAENPPPWEDEEDIAAWAPEGIEENQRDRAESPAVGIHAPISEQNSEDDVGYV
jgi:hypothetical protein